MFLDPEPPGRPGQTEYRGPDMTGTAYGVVLSFMILVIAAQAFILPSAVWQGDEYDYFANIREHGLSFLSDRLLHWSPRPFSEILIFVYGLTVNALHRPLIWVFLGLTWLFCAGVAFIPFLRQAPVPASPRLMIAASLGAIFFLGHPSADLFYWPMGTIAHLPVLAASCALVLLSLTGTLSILQEALLLTLAETSSEAGLFFTTLWLGLRAGRSMWQRTAQQSGRSAWLILPIAIWLCIAATMITNHRLHSSGFPFTPTHGHIAPSLRAAIRPFFETLLALQSDEMSGGGRFTLSAIMLGLGLKLVLTAAFTALFLSCGIRPDLRTLVTPALALAGTMYLTIAAAFYAFGFLCCQRHEAFRLNTSFLLVLLLSAALSTCLSRKWPSFRAEKRRTLEFCALAGLLVFVMWTARWRLPDLSLAIAGKSLDESAHFRSWTSGLLPGPDMTYWQGTASPAFYYAHWEPGTYHPADPGWETQSALRYFGKTTLHVRPPVSTQILPASP